MSRNRSPQISRAPARHEQQTDKPIKQWKPYPSIGPFIALIIEKGVQWDIAAETVNMPKWRAKLWLRDPRVIKYMNEKRKLLRNALCAQNEFHLARIREGDNVHAALNAIKYLEELNSEHASAAVDVDQPQQFSINIVSRDTQALTQAQQPVTIDNDVSCLDGRGPR